MLRFTFPYILFISLTGMAGSVLNAYGRFAVPAFTPVLLNLSIIGSAIWLSPRLGEPTLALAVGVFIAGVAQLLFQLPFLRKAGLLPRPRVGFAHAGVRRVLGLMLPIMFGSVLVLRLGRPGTLLRALALLLTCPGNLMFLLAYEVADRLEGRLWPHSVERASSQPLPSGSGHTHPAPADAGPTPPPPPPPVPGSG